MPHVSQSREVLTTMDSNQSGASLSFGKRNGCFVSRRVAVGIVVLFLGSVLATALLVYNYAPASHDSQPQVSKEIHLPVEADTSDVHRAGVFPGGPTATTMSPTATTMMATTKKNEKPDNVRLPRSIKPIKYLIRLQPFVNGNFSIFGYTEITLEVLEATSNITIHIADMITKNETIKLTPANDMAGAGVSIIKHEYDTDREFYIATLAQPLMAGKQYVLTMQFEALLNDKLKGFYRSSYIDANGNTRWLAATQFQPTDARRAFPCFDEPALKAKFEVYLARQTNMSSISNMPLMDTTPIKGQPGWVWDHFNTTVPMSTYLVAFVVSDFTYRNSTANDHVLFRVWAREEAIEQAEYALRIGPAMTTFYESYFDIPFPLPKQDMIALPDFSAGAMENWGLITYRETAMLYDPKVSAVSNKQRIAIIISHELAHQWFGDLVTPSWWTDLWLNEGFASYMEYLGGNAVEPTWKMLEQFVITDVQSVFGLDCLESSHPISIPVGHPDEINEIFDSISYSKGASIIRMMSHFLSESTFRAGLTKYLKHYSYDSAEQDNLWEFLTRQAHVDGTLSTDVTVKIIMDTWTLQMGYPVIKVTRNQDKTATLTQERFLLLKNENSKDTHEYKWWVPITFTTEDSPDFEQTKTREWMAAKETTKTINGLPDAGKWFIFNIQQTGYYRVNYELDNWRLLVNQLKKDHLKINVINRAQIIDDAMDLARAGMLSYEVALGVNSYLAKEEEYVPWVSALNNMGYLENMLKRTAAYGALKNYMLSMLVPLYDAVGFADNLSDPHLDQLKRVRALTWACSMGHHDCVHNSVQLFAKWMQNPANNSIISPNLKSLVFCTAISKGDEAEWNFAWTQYLNSNVGTEKDTILRALGCSKKLWILSRYLGMAFTPDSGVRKQDSSTVFGAVARNGLGRDLAWNYLRNNWDKITEYVGSSLFAFPRYIKSATGKFNTKLMLKELKQFKEDHSSTLGTASRAVEQSIEKVGNNIVWMEQNYDVIFQWLQDNGYGTVLTTHRM